MSRLGDLGKGNLEILKTRTPEKRSPVIWRSYSSAVFTGYVVTPRLNSAVGIFMWGERWEEGMSPALASPSCVNKCFRFDSESNFDRQVVLSKFVFPTDF